MSSEISKTQEKALKATWHLLEKGDPAKTRMSDIAKKAGVSRQALYLHYPSRAQLLIATARYMDQFFNMDDRLAASRAATSGKERLPLYIEAWGDYIPEVYGVIRAFFAMQETDEEIKAAWNDRLSAIRHGCEAAIRALKKDGHLNEDYTTKQATDILWTLLSVRNWEHLRYDCGWSQKTYITHVTKMAMDILVR